MLGIIIRQATIEDTDALFALRLEALKTNSEAFGASYGETIANWTSESYGMARIPGADSDSRIFVAEVDGKLTGMMGFLRSTRTKTKHTADIWGVFVQSSARGQGIGKQLLQAILDHARQCEGLAIINLAVITDNKPAIKLYESTGFIAWGTQPDALRDGGKSYDEVWMSYRLG